MAKLHELLAVSSNLRSQAEQCRADLMNTFDKKVTHFKERKVTFKPIAESEIEKVEEQLGLQTTITKEWEWISEKLAKSMDCGHQIDIANMSAVADVVLEDGTILLKAIPATSLLQLEKRIEEIQQLVQKIPTLDPTKGFEQDKDRGAGIFKARNEERKRTEKKFGYVVMVQPTDKHPAQVKELMEDKPTGIVITEEWSSLITVATKGDMLDRLEMLARAVKKARSKANENELDVKQNKIGATLLNYIFSGKHS